jgi:hypothetical protein
MSNERIDRLIEQLNAPTKVERLQALREIRGLIDSGDIPQPLRGVDVNNHIHSTYSFSPYSPTKAVFCSWQAGLTTTGLMDHDSISGAEEFIDAGLILGMPTTIGAEVRVSFAGTRLAGRRLNNPDEITVAYIALHGIPHTAIAELARFFEPISRARGVRNRAMIARLNGLLSQAGVTVDYDQDVLPISLASTGGSVTERHLLFAVARKLIARFGRGPDLVRFLELSLCLSVSGKPREFLEDAANVNYDYDLLNVLKGNLVEHFYVPASDEIPAVGEVSKLAERLGIILAYPYLGDVAESVTGDKKAQHFEDEFLDEVFETIREQGFKAVTYMPSRNTPAQLERLRNYCERYQFFQISGEDINQPRQKFICEAMRKPEFSNLYDAAWALIGHELSATSDPARGLFSPETLRQFPTLSARIAHFKAYALEHASVPL